MSHTRWALVLFLALALPGRTVAAEDPVAEAEKQAEADEKTEAGKAFARTVGEAFGRDHTATIGGCAKEARRKEFVDFRLLLRFDAAGAVDDRLVEPANGLSTCVREALKGWKVVPPPHAGTWVVVAVQLNRK